MGDPKQMLNGYPATPQGQRNFLLQIIDSLDQTHDALGRGFFYWEPAMISALGYGSFQENLAQFGFEGQALPSMGIYAHCASGQAKR